MKIDLSKVLHFVSLIHEKSELWLCVDFKKNAPTKIGAKTNFTIITKTYTV